VGMGMWRGWDGIGWDAMGWDGMGMEVGWEWHRGGDGDGIGWG